VKRRDHGFEGITGILVSGAVSLVIYAAAIAAAVKWLGSA